MPEQLEEKTLVCWPVSLEGYVVPGSLPDRCSKCGQPVWVSPSSWLIIHDSPGIIILCIPCALEEMKKDKEIKIEDISPAQTEEIREYLNNR